MKKSLIVIILVVVGLVLMGVSTYNGLVSKKENVAAKLSEIEK